LRWNELLRRRTVHQRPIRIDQAIIAILAAIVDEVRHHPVLVTRALLLGWTLRWIGKGREVTTTLETPGRFVSLEIGNWLRDTGHDSIQYWWFRTNVNMLPRWVLWWVACACIGWVIAYTHRARRPALLVFLFASSVLMAVWPRVHLNLQRHWGFVFAAVPALVGFTCTMLGGLWGSPAQAGQTSAS
jgi:hypothetical protein